MDFFDVIKELRKGNPDALKTAKAMKILSAICVFGAIWNYGIYCIGPFDKSPFTLPLEYLHLVLIGLLLLSGIFFLAARGIVAMEPWGKRSGQLGVVLLFGLLLGFIFFVLSGKSFLLLREKNTGIFFVFTTLFIAQFGVLAYFGFRYLGRLPARKTDYAGAEPIHRTISQGDLKTSPGKPRRGHVIYHDSPVPFGFLGTFALLMVVPFCIIILAEKYIGPQTSPFLPFAAGFLVFFCVVFYNRLQSRFELAGGRVLVASYTGGGSIMLLNGTWPFFRLLVYQDGLEIRVMLQRFFIPFDKVESLSQNKGFFNRGMLVKSNLPGVPSDIRFRCIETTEAVKIVREMISKCAANKT